MANDVLDIIGEKTLIQKFERLKQFDTRTSAIRAAFNRASKPLTQKARSNARQFKKTGMSWKSIKMMPSSRYKSLYWVGPARGRKNKYVGWYLKFLEKGTKHRVKKTTGRSTGYIRPKKWMQPAYNATKGKVRLNIIRELNVLIKKAAS